MSKEKSPAFQFYASDYLSDEYVSLMTVEEEGCYIRLMAYCWREGSIPNDIEQLTRLCKGVRPSELVLGRFCFRDLIADGSQADRKVHPRLEKEREKQAEHRAIKARAGQKGNEKRWAKRRKHKNLIADGSQSDRKTIAERSQTDRRAMKSTRNNDVKTPENRDFPACESIEAEELNRRRIANDRSSIFYLQSSKSSFSPSSSPSVGSATRQASLRVDEAFEVFAASFLEGRTVAYEKKRGDFVRLAALRKRLEISSKAVPPRWQVAVDNYFASPLTKYTLADLCERFDTFVLSEVDRYGRPVGFDDARQAGRAKIRNLRARGFFDQGEETDEKK